jgi:hypothetical protein
MLLMDGKGVVVSYLYLALEKLDKVDDLLLF